MIKIRNRKAVFAKKHRSVRKAIFGTSLRPRLAVHRSNKHIYAQVIDDTKGVTLVSASTTEKALNVENGGDVAAGTLIGKTVGQRAKDAGIDTVVFDRGGYLYHGRVAAVAEGAREAGLDF